MEIPYVEIVSGPSARRYHYRLDNDQASRLPLGLFRINDSKGHLRIEHFNNGPRQAVKKKPPKFQPKRPKRQRPAPPPA